MRKIRAADLFCGAGGTSHGMVRAAKKLGCKLDLLAINHWDVAIATHSKNHKQARHLCETLDGVDPRKVVPGGKLDVMFASPECTHHSNARGGKPKSDQSRASAWHVVRWAEALNIRRIVVENVREFRDWGPLGSDGKPLKSKKGTTFQAFIIALESLNYRVEHRILNAADYGDPTTRKRLIIIAQKGNRKIRWPKQTYSEDGTIGKKWVAAREIIEWDKEGTSIFNRKKPLAPNTMRRIAAGMRKFAGIDLDPFLIKFYGTNDAASVHKPCPTIVGAPHIGVAEPFLVNMKGKSNASDIKKPTKTQTTKQHQYVVQPFLLQQQSKGAPRSTGKPVPTVAGAGAISKIESFLVEVNHGKGKRKAKGLKQTMGTITAKNGRGIVEPFIVEFHGGKDSEKRTKSLKKPLPTADCSNRFGLIVSAGGPKKGPLSVDKPMDTVLTREGRAIAFIVPQHSSNKPRSVGKPVPTITTTSRGIAFVTPLAVRVGKKLYALDIKFRMLTLRELARAQGFPDHFEFTGTKSEGVKQVGNAVPGGLAYALSLEALR